MLHKTDRYRCHRLPEMVLVRLVICLRYVTVSDEKYTDADITDEKHT